MSWMGWDGSMGLCSRSLLFVIIENAYVRRVPADKWFGITTMKLTGIPCFWYFEGNGKRTKLKIHFSLSNIHYGGSGETEYPSEPFIALRKRVVREFEAKSRAAITTLLNGEERARTNIFNKHDLKYNVTHGIVDLKLYETLLVPSAGWAPRFT